MTSLHLKKSIGLSQLRRGLLLIPLVLAYFALLPTAQAVTPAPDGGYPGYNTAEGQNALLNLVIGGGFWNTALGAQALHQDTNGSFNTAVGLNALYFNNGNSNVAVGVQALQSNTTGPVNTALGFQALFSNTDGGANTATGYQALFSNTSGSGNTAVGSQALSNNNIGGLNTATGIGALSSNTTGGDNTATGDEALFSNTSGDNNTAVGAYALFNNTGTANIALGVFAGDMLTTGSFNIDIGNAGGSGESRTIRIGSVQTRTFIGGIYGVTATPTVAIPVLVSSTGQLGTASSSRRFKKDIGPMEKASEAILALKPVTFHYKSDSTGTPQFGLIAEEVAKANPDLVVRDEKGKIYTVRYDAVNVMLLNEFLKEHRKVEEQNGKLENQARKIQDQETTITQLKKGMETVVARLKEQDSKIQKVSDQIELSKPARQTVLNNQ